MMLASKIFAFVKVSLPQCSREVLKHRQIVRSLVRSFSTFDAGISWSQIVPKDF